MTQELLDDANRHAFHHQVRGERVPQRMLDSRKAVTEIIEVKSGGGKFREHDIKQLENYRRLVGEGATVKVGENMEKLERIRYVFSNPKGAKANLGHVKKLVKDGHVVDVFDEAGKRVELRSQRDIPDWMLN